MSTEKLKLKMGEKVKEFTVMSRRSKHPNKMCPEGVKRKNQRKLLKK